MTSGQPAAIMPVTLQHDHDNVYRLNISGVLRKADLDRSQDALITVIDRAAGGTVRLLVVLDEFQGWDPESNWSDLTFYIKYGDRIERIAIVGDERWRDLALMFASADLRRAPVEFFAATAIAEARAWLSR